MTSLEARDRVEALRDLLEMRGPLVQVLAAVSRLPWDSDVELIELSCRHVTELLKGYLRREVDSSDLQAWANTVEGREDIGYHLGQQELLAAFVYETANPALNQEISDGFVLRWLDRFEKARHAVDPAR